MNFAEAVQEYLEDPENAPETILDFQACRARLVANCARLAGTDLDESKQLLREWNENHRINQFCFEVARHLTQRYALPHADVRRLVDAAVDALTSAPKGLSAQDALLVDEVIRNCKHPSARGAFGRLWRAEYSREIRAIRQDGSITKIGSALVELTGKDVLRWMLHVEASQAMGNADRWRISRAVAAILVAQPSHVVPPSEWTHDAWSWPFSWETITRLSAMDLVDDILGDDCWLGYRLKPGAVDLLREISEGAETPLAMLASTFLHDATNRIVAEHVKIDRALDRSATDAGARQARMIVHEIRNALMPVRLALRGLTDALGDSKMQHLAEPFRPIIDAGIERLFRYAADTQKVLDLGDVPAAPFSIMTAVRDAEEVSIQNVNLENRLPADLPPVMGRATSFVDVIVNLIRNAAQTRSDRRVRIVLAGQVSTDARRIVLTIDDDGPGVPTTFREAIFTEGYSLRPGGSGLGLAFVRRVVEAEMHGKVSCDVSELGGARFTIDLPVSGTSLR